MGKTNPDPNGFRSVLSVMQMVELAYGSVDSGAGDSVKLLNLPDWQGQFYDIAAKMSQADLTAWQHQRPEHELLRLAMRTALRERFKLVVHEQPFTGDIFELVVAKGGVRLRPTTPANDPRPPARTEMDRPADGGWVEATEKGRPEKTFWDQRPGGMFVVFTVENGKKVKTSYENLPGGGVLRVRQDGSAQGISQDGGLVTTFYNAPVKDLVYHLNRVAGRVIPVRDKTRLSGRYDFTITNLPRDPDQDEIYRYPLKRLGLEIRRGTEQRAAVVVDHIERPSPN
jgi:uncharacterized protein (TIGR03435 family)